ncbi:DUF2269 domain-containing protein [Actinomycetospora sp. CA-101289]|uniref:DUF2269 domain-containing protein n=1 Tax=Actinomycetospora sp. CA-101289 TaxID=3239893 RepID=UPI003D99034B
MLTVHLVVSVGWIGAVLAYLALGVAATTTGNGEVVRAAWVGMALTGWFVIVPLAVAAFVTGVVMSLGTPWGLLRHYWVIFALVLTGVSVLVLVLHMPTVSAQAELAQRLGDAEVSHLGGDLLHPSVGLLVLLVITVLNVFKPRGTTSLGQRALQRRRRVAGASAAPSR